VNDNCNIARGTEFEDMICPGKKHRYSEPFCSNREVLFRSSCAFTNGEHTITAGVIYDQERWHWKDHSQWPPHYQCTPQTKFLEFDKLAITMSVYPVSYGHFLFVLVKMLFMDAVLPRDVKIYVHVANNAVKDVPKKWLTALYDAGIIKPERILTLPDDQPHHVVMYAKEMYWMLNTHFEHLGNGMLELDRARRALVPEHPPVAQRNVIVVMQRKGGSRSLPNHDEVVRLLKAEFEIQHMTAEQRNATTLRKQIAAYFPQGMEVRVHTGHSSLKEEIEEFWKPAALMVGPHGAGMQNMLFMPQGAPICEICYSKPSCPHMYYMLASNLGLPYYSLFGQGQSYQPLKIPTQDVVDIVKMMVGFVVGQSTDAAGVHHSRRADYLADAQRRTRCGLKEVKAVAGV
jgi:hypothetical protein